MIQRRTHFAVVVLGLVVLAATIVCTTTAAAEVRRLESIGVVPVDPRTRSSVPLRDQAIQMALREGVSRIARGLMATGGAIALPSEGDTKSGTPELSDEALSAMLGRKPVDYTTGYRILEDRGERPALFAEGAQFATEYQVVIELHVDVDRVRSQLVAAGMLRAPEALEEFSGIRVRVLGLSTYPGYRALRALLLEELGISQVTPVEFTKESIIVELTVEDRDFDLMRRLVQAGPPAFEISPLESKGSEMQVAVKWDPSAKPGLHDLAPWPTDFEESGSQEREEAERTRRTPGGGSSERER